jgi:hypothetical protein
MDVSRYLGRIDENPGADDPAHDQHRRIERTEATDQAVASGIGAAHAASMTSRME